MSDNLIPTSQIGRRSWLFGATGLLGASLASRRGLAADKLQAKIHSTRVISQQPAYYHGWPTLARRANGQLLVVSSAGREAHVCPFGRVELMRSDDNGTTWTWPRTILDGPIDDRDAGILETPKGSLLATTFTSLAYEPILAKAIKEARQGKASWPPARIQQWKNAHNRVSAVRRAQSLGVWMIRSTDDGVSWSKPYDCLVNSPHGPIALRDGRLLYAGKQLWKSTPRNGVAHSSDDGQSWQWLAEIPTRPGDDAKNYHELHAVEVDGRLIAHIRNHNTKNAREILQSDSQDGGETWSQPRPIGVWGLPSHLIRLRDGRLLMSYGHRRSPLGNQARISRDDGQSWSEPLSISNDGISGDLGYPSTAELADGSLLTVWYERMKGSANAVLRQAHWSL